MLVTTTIGAVPCLYFGETLIQVSSTWILANQDIAPGLIGSLLNPGYMSILSHHPLGKNLLTDNPLQTKLIKSLEPVWFTTFRRESVKSSANRTRNH